MSPAINPPFATRGQLGSRQPPQAPSPPSPPAESRATTPPSNGSAAIPAPGIMAGGPAGFVASAIAKSSAANSSPSHRHSFGAFAPATDPVLAYKPLPPRPLSTVGEYGPGHPSATASAAVPLSVPPAAGQPISIPPDVLLHASNTAAAASTTPPHGPEVSTTTTAQVVENYHGGQHYHHHHHHHHHHFHPSPSSTSLNAAFQTVSPPEDNSPRASFDVPRHAALQVTIPSRAANASSDSFGGHGIVSGGIPLTANSPFPLTSAPIPPTTMYPSGSGGGNSRNSSMDFIVQAQAPIAIPSTDTAVPSSLTNTPSSQMITSTASTVTVVNLSPMSPVTLEPASCSTSNSGSPASSSESLPGHGGQHSHHPAPSTRSPSLSTVSLHSVGTSSPLARGSVDYHQPLSAGPVQPAPHFRRSSSTNPRTSLANLASSASNTQPSSASVPLGSASSPSLANATVGSSSRASAAPSNVTASPSSAAAAAQAAAAAAASYVLTRVDNVGNVTDQYIVGNCIGRGSFGAVFRAIHMESHHTVAIKRFALADRKQMESILKEVRKMESLDHPNVVKYLGYVQTDKDFNIILEYVENGSLASTLKHFGPLPERVVGSIVCKVLQGLVYLHDRGLKHLDLKAANILTTKDGCVKLSDFGVSQSSVDTSSDKFVGSAYWMAPEVITLEGTHTASDIWSLGCTIIELLTGLPPYFDLLAMSALYKIVEDGCPPFPEGISPQLKDFLSSCFRKDCKERATARALLEHVWMIPFVHMVGAVNGLAIVGPPPVPTRPDLAAVQQQQVAHVMSAPNLTVDLSQLPPMTTQFKRPAPPPPPSSATSPGSYSTPITVVSEPSPITPSPSPAVPSSRAEPSPDAPIPRARTPAPPRASLDARPSSMLISGRPSTPSKSAPSSPANANPRQVKEFYPPVTLTPMSATRQQPPAYPSRTPPPAPTMTPSPLAVSASRTPTLKRSQSAGSSITGSGTKSNRSSILPPGTKDALQALMGSRSRTKSTDALPTSGTRSPPLANLSRRSSDHMLVAPRFFAPPPPPSVPPTASSDPSASLLSKSAPTKPGFVVPVTAPPPPVPPTSLARSLAHKWVKATFASVVLCANCKQQIRKGRVCHDCSTAVCKPCANGEDGRKGMVCNVSSYRYSMVSVASIQGTDSLIGPQSVSGTPPHHPHLQHQQHFQQRAPARKTRAPLSNLIGSADLAALSESASMSSSPPSAEAHHSATTTPEGTLDKKPAHKRSGLMMGLVSPGKRASFMASSREELPTGGKGMERRGSSAKLDGGAPGSGSASATAERMHSAANARPKAREDCVVM